MKALDVSTRAPRARSVRHSGMTLVEVMLAIAILVTGLIAIFALISTAIQSHRRAVAETEVSMIASSALAELRGEFANGHIPISDGKTKFDEVPGFPDYTINRQLFPLDRSRRGAEDGLDREYFVRVEVRWSQRGDNKSVVVQTIIFNNRKLNRTSARR